MKQDTIIGIVIVALLALASAVGVLSAKEDESTEFLIQANRFKLELINAQAEALEAAHKIISKHDIADVDGSDEFVEYLELSNKVDSLLNTQL